MYTRVMFYGLLFVLLLLLFVGFLGSYHLREGGWNLKKKGRTWVLSKKKAGRATGQKKAGWKKKMWYDRQWDNSPSKTKCRRCKQLYSVTERPSTRSLGSHRQLSYKGIKMNIVKQFKPENQQPNLYTKRKTKKNIWTTATSDIH